MDVERLEGLAATTDVEGLAQERGSACYRNYGTDVESYTAFIIFSGRWYVGKTKKRAWARFQEHWYSRKRLPHPLHEAENHILSEELE